MTAAARLSRESSGVRAVLTGGTIAGALDLLDAFAFYIPRGATAIRIPQSIASGLLGPAAFDGGAATAALGTLLHFFIACSAAAVYYAASRRLPVLTRKWVPCGLAFGLCVFFFMRQIVLPLSLVRHSPFFLPAFLNGIAIHTLGIGLPIAYFTRKYGSA